MQNKKPLVKKEWFPMRYEFLILAAAVLWGGTNVASKQALATLSGPFTNAVRCTVAAVTILFISFKRPLFNKVSVVSGFVVGVLNVAILTLRVKTLVLLPVGVCMFLTATYIVFIPVLQRIFFKNGLRVKHFLCILVSLFGSGLMCVQMGQISLNIGVVLALLSAVLVALQMVAVDKCKTFGDVDMNTLTFMEMAMSGVAFLVIAVLGKSYPSSLSMNEIVLLVFSGILGTGVAMLLFNTALPHVSSVRGSIISSTESVFAAVFGYLFLQEQMTVIQVVGSVLILVSSVVVLWTRRTPEIDPKIMK